MNEIIKLIIMILLDVLSDKICISDKKIFNDYLKNN